MRPLNVRVPAAVLALALALGATDARRAPRTLLQDDPAASEASPEVLGTLGTLDPRWSSHAAQLARSCGGNETEAPGDAPSSVPSSTEYVPCLAREVDDAVAALNDVPGAMCTLVSLVADNHLGVRRCLTAGTHPRRRSPCCFDDGFEDVRSIRDGTERDDASLGSTARADDSPPPLLTAPVRLPSPPFPLSRVTSPPARSTAIYWPNTSVAPLSPGRSRRFPRRRARRPRAIASPSSRAPPS